MVTKLKKKELCIIHIGMHKTGSSSIQNYLQNYLDDDSFFYPDLGSANQSAIIYTMFSDNPEKYHSFRSRGFSRKKVLAQSKRNKNILIEKIIKSKTKIMLLSAEDIINMPENSLKELKCFLLKYFNSIQIIGYIRPVHLFIQSAFQERVKHGLNRFDINQINPRYDRFLKFYQIFGENNVSIIPFVRNKLLKKDIVLDFCKRVGIDVNSSYVYISDNETLSKEVISLLYTYHRFIAKPYTVGNQYFQERNILLDKIKKLGSTKFTFSKKLTEQIVNKNIPIKKELEKLSACQLPLDEDIKDDIYSVFGEQDLFICAMDQRENLIKIIGPKELSKDLLANTPENIAKLMYVLKNKLLIDSGLLKENIKTKKEIVLVKRKDREYNILKNLNIDWSNYHKVNDINDTSIDPIMHYIDNWRKEDLVIENYFSTFFYLNQYSDIKKAKINPLIHYVKHGINEGRKGIDNE